MNEVAKEREEKTSLKLNNKKKKQKHKNVLSAEVCKLT